MAIHLHDGSLAWFATVYHCIIKGDVMCLDPEILFLPFPPVKSETSSLTLDGLNVFIPFMRFNTIVSTVTPFHSL